MTPTTETLPRWNLSDLFASDKAAKQAVLEAEKLSVAFVAQYASKVKTLSATQILEAILKYERISDLLTQIGSYAYLQYIVDMESATKAAFYQYATEQLASVSSKLTFFTVEINLINDADFATLISHAELQKYVPFLHKIRRFKSHQLSAELEEFAIKKSVSSSNAWVRLFDETTASLEFSLNGQKVGISEILNGLSSADEKMRQTCAKELETTFAQNSKIFTFITNTLAKDKHIDDEYRKFAQPISERNLHNFIEDDVVACLLETVQKNYAKTSHRYYALKAKFFGRKTLKYWDRNAPLPFCSDKTYSWDEAKDITRTAYGEFSKTMLEIGDLFFQSDWIDVPPQNGKDSGAFAHPTSPSVHPYLMLNYYGKVRDVATLAHELGHGVHQHLARHNGPLMCDTPLTLAETASVFGEQLVFQKLLANETDTNSKIALLAGKIEDMLNTVVRQVAFCEFERIVHDERRAGEVSTVRLGEIWMQIQHDSLGEAIELSDGYKNFWMYIPHFIHSPFYVYAYAFGDCLVNSLYSIYKSGTIQNFEEKYLTMLSAGGTLHHKELLAPFGIDISKADFWQQGLNIIIKMIDDLENLVSEHKAS